MRNLLLLFFVLLLSTSSIYASETTDSNHMRLSNYSYDNSFVFVENGITFSVFPDGEFDFYAENIVSGHRNGNSFNAGFDYSAYTQYDDYGAVIQVENIPIYYDYYGRVNQIGAVSLNYRNNQLHQIGGMFISYNNRGIYQHHRGFINNYNRNYVFHPHHNWFVRPSLAFRLVLNSPYRRHYTPTRYSYHLPYRNNSRRCYARIGNEYRNTNMRSKRAAIYRNDTRVTVNTRNSRATRNTSLRANGLGNGTNGLRNVNKTSRRPITSRTSQSRSTRNTNRPTVSTRQGNGVSIQNKTSNRNAVARTQTLRITSNGNVARNNSRSMQPKARNNRNFETSNTNTRVSSRRIPNNNNSRSRSVTRSTRRTPAVATNKSSRRR